MREIRTAVDIQAPVQRVWDLLMDFERYPEWNPFITYIDGPAVKGGVLSIRVIGPNGKPTSFSPVVMDRNAPFRFAWKGRLIVPGFFDGHHIFELEAITETRTLLVHREEFNGLLIPVMWGDLNTKTRQGFEQMNAALKARAEGA